MTWVSDCKRVLGEAECRLHTFVCGAVPNGASAAAQAEVQSLRSSLAEWQSISELAGVADAFVMGPVTPSAVASELARARESEKQLQV